MLAILAPHVPLAYLVARFAVARARRGDVPDWRGGLRSARTDRGCPAAPARPLFLARARSGVVRVAAAWPVAAGVGGDPAAVRAGVAFRLPATRRQSSSRRFSACCSLHPSWPLSSPRRSASRIPRARFLWRDAVHRDAAADQRFARRRQAEGDDLEHACRVAAGPGRHPARAETLGHLAGGDRTSASADRSRGDAPRGGDRAAGIRGTGRHRRGSSSCRACTSA